MASPAATVATEVLLHPAAPSAVSTGSRPLKYAAIAGLTVAALAWTSGILWCGSVRNVFRYANGQRIVIEPAVADISHNPTEVTHVPFTIRNMCLQTVTVTGGHTGCGCSAVEDLPVSIPGGRRATVFVSVDPSPEPATRKFPVRFYVETHGQREKLRVMIREVAKRDAP